MEKRGTAPAVFIEADNLAQAHYRAAKAVWEKGIEIRTQYDRKDDKGMFIDPLSKDATVAIFIPNPFSEPRYPAISFVERGVYIAEIMGAKDHYVVPYEILKSGSWGTEGGAKEWPYTYSQRLREYPTPDGRKINQLEEAIKRLVKDPISRRAVCTTRLPDIDVDLKEDIPCLGEVHLRCTEEDGQLYLNMRTYWRSRDLFKAWPDNVVAITFLQQHLAKQLGEKLRREVKVGSYFDVSTSLHLYGQDISMRGVEAFVKLGEQNAVDRAMTSADAGELLVVPELEELTTEAKIEEWQFPPKTVEMIRCLAQDIKSGRLVA